MPRIFSRREVAALSVFRTVVISPVGGHSLWRVLNSLQFQYSLFSGLIPPFSTSSGGKLSWALPGAIWSFPVSSLTFNSPRVWLASIPLEISFISFVGGMEAVIVTSISLVYIIPRLSIPATGEMFIE